MMSRAIPEGAHAAHEPAVISRVCRFLLPSWLCTLPIARFVCTPSVRHRRAMPPYATPPARAAEGENTPTNRKRLAFALLAPLRLPLASPRGVGWRGTAAHLQPTHSSLGSDGVGEGGGARGTGPQVRQTHREGYWTSCGLGMQARE